MRPWIITATNKRAYILEPDKTEICLDDIVIALSNKARYGGHTYRPLFVAQHCCIVAWLLREFGFTSQHLQRIALLHDAAEAYLVDVPSPIKRLYHLEKYVRLENEWQERIYSHFGINDYAKHAELIKRFDMMSRLIEGRILNINMADWQDLEPHAAEVEKLLAIKPNALLKTAFNFSVGRAEYKTDLRIYGGLL